MPTVVNQSLIKSLFDYKHGNLYWKNNMSNRIKSGQLAGSIRPPQNYRYIGINKKYYAAHRLIFLYHYGYLPDYVDHIDNNVLNNKIENLRGCNHIQNGMNVLKSVKNTSGYKGISWYKSNNSWCAKLKINGKVKRKFFFDKEQAFVWLSNERKMHHGEFANNG